MLVFIRINRRRRRFKRTGRLIVRHCSNSPGPEVFSGAHRRPTGLLTPLYRLYLRILPTIESEVERCQTSVQGALARIATRLKKSLEKIAQKIAQPDLRDF